MILKGKETTLHACLIPSLHEFPILFRSLITTSLITARYLFEYEYLTAILTPIW